MYVCMFVYIYIRIMLAAHCFEASHQAYFDLFLQEYFVNAIYVSGRYIFFPLRHVMIDKNQI